MRRGPKKHSPAAKSQIAAAIKALWQNPEYRARVRAAVVHPDAKKKRIAAGKALWANPEHRAKHRAAIDAYYAQHKRKWKTPIIQTRWRKDAAGREGYKAMMREKLSKRADPEGYEIRLALRRKNRKSQNRSQEYRDRIHYKGIRGEESRALSRELREKRSCTL